MPLRHLFTRSSSSRSNDFSWTLLPAVLMFNNRLQYAKTQSYVACMIEATLAFFFALGLTLFVFACFYRFVKSPSEEEIKTRERKRRDWQKMGYGLLARELFVDAFKGSSLAMTAMFFFRPEGSRFGYGHYLLASVFASLCAGTLQLVALYFSARLASASPRLSSSATLKVRWPFKGNK